MKDTLVFVSKHEIETNIKWRKREEQPLKLICKSTSGRMNIDYLEQHDELLYHFSPTAIRVTNISESCHKNYAR